MSTMPGPSLLTKNVSSNSVIAPVQSTLVATPLQLQTALDGVGQQLLRWVQTAEMQPAEFQSQVEFLSDARELFRKSLNDLLC